MVLATLILDVRYPGSPANGNKIEGATEIPKARFINFRCGKITPVSFRFETRRSENGYREIPVSPWSIDAKVSIHHRGSRRDAECTKKSLGKQRSIRRIRRGGVDRVERPYRRGCARANETVNVAVSTSGGSRLNRYAYETLHR